MAHSFHAGLGQPERYHVYTKAGDHGRCLKSEIEQATSTLHERTRGPVTGLGLTIDYAGGMARISMPDFPALREGGEFERATRNKLMGLADAIREAAQSPDGIFWHHRERI